MTVVREIRDVATLVMGTSPKGDTYNSAGDGMPLLNGPTEFGAVHPDCTLFTTARTRRGEAGDLLFCVRGSTTGRMNWGDRAYALGRGVASIRAETPLETRFVRYCLEVRLPALLKRANGGTFPNLKKDDIASFVIPWPESRHQIAAVLAAYDELIENNLRRIEILEEMAQAIYREWFVKFRYPGHEADNLVDSPLGPIPDGWRMQPIGRVATVVRSHVDPSQHADSEFVHYSFAAFDAGRVPALQKGSDLRSGKLAVEQPSVLLAKLNPRIPRVWLVVPPSNPPAIASSEFLILVPTAGTPLSLIYAMLSHASFGARLAAMAGGTSTSHQRLKQRDLEAIEIAVPPNDLLRRFDDAVEPMLTLTRALVESNVNLRTTRDLLLPKLVSGEIDVSDLDIDTSWLAT